jgi:ABC-2 type transport system ATP-binding protein
MTSDQRPGQGSPAAGGWWGTESVTVRYGSRVALEHVSFRAVAGQVSVVVGGDGSGRTTLLRCLAGAVAPASGQVRRPPAAQLGYLPATSGIYPDLSVAENLAFRAAAYGVPAARMRERAALFLERAGLAAVPGRLAGQLSGGMRQKLGVIAAMVHQPRLLVLDEPTTGVDPVSRADLWWLITAAAAGGAAVAVSTAYLDDAERAASVLVLDAGHALAAGTPAQIAAGMPGVIRSVRAAPAGAERRRAWRRGAAWRVWDDSGQAADAVQPDLQDAVTVAALVRELEQGGDRP